MIKSQYVGRQQAQLHTYHGPGQLLMDPISRVAIITGASTCISYATAYELMKAGVMRVVLSDTNCKEGFLAAKKLCCEFGDGAAIFLNGDINDPWTYVRLFEETIARYQKVDILFNNAGLFDDKNWVQEVNTNIKSVIRSTQLAQRYMNKKRNKDLRGSVVINNANSFSLDTLPLMPIHSSSKHAIIGFSRSMGDIQHYGRTGVRVVALCSGLTKADGLHPIYTQKLDHHWGSEMERLLSPPTVQDATAVGKAVVHLACYAPSGSVWVVENSQLLEANIPKHTFCKNQDKPYKNHSNVKSYTPSIQVQKPRRRPSSFTHTSKLHAYRVKGKWKQRSSNKR